MKTLLCILGCLLLCNFRATAATVFVTTGGNDGNDGQTWAGAKKTVTAALAAANAGDQIHVAGGTYAERISLKKGVALYGGYAGVGDQRDCRLYPTVLDGGAGGCVVLCQDATVGLDTQIDGFVIQHGKGLGEGGIGVVGGAPTIANNVIQNNYSTGEGAGICCYNGAHPLILNNVIHDNTATGAYGDGAGICCMAGDSPGTAGSYPQIVGNSIYYNMADQDGGGICSKGGSAPVIVGNNITMNVSGLQPSEETPANGERLSYGAGGIGCVEGGTATIRDNLITANAGLYGGGILVYDAGSGIEILNNTIVGNSPNGVRWQNSTPIIVNNIVQGNGVGISRQWGAPGGAPVFSHNSVFGNAIDFDGLDNPGFANGNLPADARLASPNFNNFHLQPFSPCREAGDPTYLVANETDVYGKPRVTGVQVDIGADESDGTLWNVVTNVIRVNPGGNDNNDGSAWSLAKQHLAAALAAGEAAGGAQIWVKQGTYVENSLALRPFVYLYGGFAGNEASLADRNVSGNPTVLDGNNVSFVIRAIGGYRLSTVDGFTITRGKQTATLAQSGGVSSLLNGALIQNNVILGNNAPLGAGIGLYGSTACIQNNVIVSNTAASDGGGIGAGIHGDRSTPLIQNNNLHHNTASAGGGIYFSMSKPWIVNNLIHDNMGNGINCQNAKEAAWLNADALLIGGNLIYRNLSDSGGGGGIYLLYCAGTIAANLILANASGGTTGGGLSLTHGDDLDGALIVANNTIVGNQCNYAQPWGMVFQGAGIYLFLLKNPTAILANNIVAGNQTGIFNLAASLSPVSPVLANNDVFGNTLGSDHEDYQTTYLQGGPLNHPSDLSLDPLFVGSGQFDFHLQAGSPCVDAGAAPYAATADLEGVPLPQDGDHNGTFLPDMGAFEYYPAAVAAPANVAASAGAFPNRILLTWTPVPNANSYEIWRQPAATPGVQPVLLHEALGQTNNVYFDFEVSPGVTNTYFVQAKLTVNHVTVVNSGGTPDYAFQPVVYLSDMSPGANGSVSVASLTPYQQWRQNQFTASELTNSSISGDLADPDNDKLPNIAEYALGLNPKAADPPGALKVATWLDSDNGLAYATLTYRLAKPPPADLVPSVEFCTNLAASTWATNGVAVIGTSDQGTFTETQVRPPLSLSESSQGFLRLRLRLTTP